MERALRALAMGQVGRLAEFASPAARPEDPLCGVCMTLLGLYNDAVEEDWTRESRAWYTILMYHDEATYDPDGRDWTEDPWGDYLSALGLAGIVTYSRCGKVYAAAERELKERLGRSISGL